MYVYSSKVTWTEGRRGKLTCGNGHKTNFSAPPEFSGEPGFITAEDALVSAVNMSFLQTFLKFAEKEKLAIVAYECNCNGIIDRTMPRVAFKRIVIHPKVTVASDEYVQKTEESLQNAEKFCVVCNSIKPKIVLEYKIELEKKEKDKKGA